jgi:hypothetical protein
MHQYKGATGVGYGFRGRGESFRTLYESMSRDGGIHGFSRRFNNLLGYSNDNGDRYFDSFGRPTLVNPKDGDKELQRISPRGVAFAELAEGIIGENWAHKLTDINLRQRAAQYTHLLEAGTNANVPTDFININAFTAAVTGLYEVAFLEGYNYPEFIGDTLCPPEQTKTFGGKKAIGIAALGDKAEVRLPGMPTARAKLGEKWLNTPVTEERALSVEVLQEVAFLDLTGEVSNQVNEVGYWLGKKKEFDQIDTFIGVSTATQYNLNGVTYNTYIAAGAYDNTFSNELIHDNDIEEVLIKFRDMKDPFTDNRIDVQPDSAIVMLDKYKTARTIFGDLATAAQYRDATGSPQRIEMYEPAYKGLYKLIMGSQYFYERVYSGLASSNASNTGKYWWMWDSRNGGPFRYAYNWPLRIQSAVSNTMDMIDRGIVMFIKGDERGKSYVREPRKIVRCTN